MASTLLLLILAAARDESLTRGGAVRAALFTDSSGTSHRWTTQPSPPGPQRPPRVPAEPSLAGAIAPLNTGHTRMRNQVGGAVTEKGAMDKGLNDRGKAERVASETLHRVFVWRSTPVEVPKAADGAPRPEAPG